MVARQLIPLLAFLLLVPETIRAQNYSVHDTVTEYPNKGTYYHDKFEGRKCASGEIFDQNKFTAAHWCIKMGTYVMVTNRNSGLQVIVKVNDRCPKRGVFDMSRRAANAIGIRGMQPVTIRLLPDDYADRWAAQETMFDSVHSRLNPRTPAATPPPQVKPAPTPKATGSKTTYNLQLGTAATHGEMYAMLHRLPAKYRDSAEIETMDDSDSLCLTLGLKLSKAEARQTADRLRKSFPNVKIVAAD